VGVLLIRQATEEARALDRVETKLKKVTEAAAKKELASQKKREQLEAALRLKEEELATHRGSTKRHRKEWADKTKKKGEKIWSEEWATAKKRVQRASIENTGPSTEEEEERRVPLPRGG